MVVDMGWDVWQQDKHYHGKLEPIHNVIKNHGLFHLYLLKKIGFILSDGQKNIVK